MSNSEIPRQLALLIAEFERSGVGELRLTGPDFELVLRAGRPSAYRDRRESGLSGGAAS